MNKSNKFILGLLLLLVLLSGFNFLPQLKLNTIPMFQILLVIIIIILVVKRKKFYMPKKYIVIKYYWYYLLISLISLIIGFSFEPVALVTYLYGLFPFLLFILTYRSIDENSYNKLLSVMNISMLLITILGWMIRLEILDYNMLDSKIIESQFNLGYWGIRYIESTRNADYLYPLIGLSISVYHYLKRKNAINFLLIIFYALTLMASLSRAALIIAIITILILFVLTSKRNKIILFTTFIGLIVINFHTIEILFEKQYSSIISSIFTLESTDYRFSNTDRINIIKHALYASILNPFGYGIDNYGVIYSYLNIEDKIVYSGENAYLTILVERGWVAFFFFMLFWSSLFKNIFRNKYISFNTIAVPLLFIYFSFNYELNNVFACFIFYFIFLDGYLVTKENT